jgi:hypothetical protein
MSGFYCYSWIPYFNTCCCDNHGHFSEQVFGVFMCLFQRWGKTGRAEVSWWRFVQKCGHCPCVGHAAMWRSSAEGWGAGWSVSRRQLLHPRGNSPLYPLDGPWNRHRRRQVTNKAFVWNSPFVAWSLYRLRCAGWSLKKGNEIKWWHEDSKKFTVSALW